MNPNFAALVATLFLGGCAVLGAHLGAPRLLERRLTRRSARGRNGLAIRSLALAILLASAGEVRAQAARNGPEWGGKDHQPTESEVIQREKQAGIRPPPGQVDRNQQTVDQLGRELLREEGVAPSPPPSR
ncbi:MAG TPA: hypothetical protein VE650_09120 [Acetobacteraceae bacterium]|jgi:hypothetical protein|nr:hypothetical protein [Acetobacteraceae bacterium]